MVPSGSSQANLISSHRSIWKPFSQYWPIVTSILPRRYLTSVYIVALAWMCQVRLVAAPMCADFAEKVLQRQAICGNITRCTWARNATSVRFVPKRLARKVTSQLMRWFTQERNPTSVRPVAYTLDIAIIWNVIFTSIIESNNHRN